MTEQAGSHVPPEVPDALSAYWDRRVTGGAPDAADVSEGLSAVVNRLHASDGTPALSPSQRRQIWQAIMAAQALDTVPHNTIAPHVPGTNGRVPGLPYPPSTATASRVQRGSRPEWPLAQLAAAALLVLTVVGSFLVFGSAHLDHQGFVPSLLPAISGTPAASAHVVTDTLLDTSVSDLPMGRLRVAVDRWTLQPSPSAVTLPAHEGAVVLTVNVGTLTVTAAGTDHQLTAGAALDVTNEEFAFHASGTAEAIAYVVYAIPQFTAEVGYGAHQIWLSGDPLLHTHDVVISTAAETVPAGSARLVLERLTLPPGSALPPQVANSWVWTRAEAGTLGLTLEGDRLPSGWDSGTEREFPPFFQNLLPAVAPGTTMVMRNAGDDPLVLYRLTLAPTGVGGAVGTEVTGASPVP